MREMKKDSSLKKYVGDKIDELNREKVKSEIMKKNLFKTALIILLLAGSCDEPETTVTNIVHRDGSVTRIVEMKNSLDNINFDILFRFHTTLHGLLKIPC
ncbi:MAG: hypothetical protein MZV63_28740 [Marinilabiliales bacterium]|nr:hypothetical protein [Marinilabiliales bacterium]